MSASTTHARPPVAHPDRFFIGGRWVAPSSSATINVIAPATEELYLSVAAANEADIDRAVDAARTAFDSGPWPRLSPIERAAYLTRLADELDRRAGDLARVWPNEMGIPRTQLWCQLSLSRFTDADTSLRVSQSKWPATTSRAGQNI